MPSVWPNQGHFLWINSTRKTLYNIIQHFLYNMRWMSLYVWNSSPSWQPSEWSLKNRNNTEKDTRLFHHGWNWGPIGPVLLPFCLPSWPDTAHLFAPLLALATPHQVGEAQPGAWTSPAWIIWVCVCVCAYGCAPRGPLLLHQHSPRCVWHLQITV